MGKIASATTAYAIAYLTEKGRTYLFNKNNVRFDTNGNDLFEIQTFTLGDPDSNYRTAERLVSGDVPDITGKGEGSLKATTDFTQSSLAYYTVDSNALANPLYSTDVNNNDMVVNTDSAFPTNQASDAPPTGYVTTTSPTGPSRGSGTATNLG
jgi:hypothetical protein